MPNPAKTIPAEIIKSLTLGGVNEALLKPAIKFCEDATSKGVAPATIALAATGVPIAPVIACVTLFAGVKWWEIRKGRAEKAKADAAIADTRKALEAIRDNTSETQRTVTEILERRSPVWARLSGADQAQLAERINQRITADLAEFNQAIGTTIPDLQADLEGRLDDQNIVLFDTNLRIRDLSSALARIEAATSHIPDLLEAMSRIEAHLPAIAESQARTLEVKVANKQLASYTRELESEREELRERLKDANRRLAEHRIREGHSPDEVIAELRETDPRRLFESLSSMTAQQEDAYASATATAREHLVAHHQDLAQIAFRLGEMQAAERSARRILDLAPSDWKGALMLSAIEMVRGNHDDAKQWTARILDDQESEDKQRAAAYLYMGSIDLIQGNLAEAETAFNRAAEASARRGDAAAVARADTNLAAVHFYRSEYPAAKAKLERADASFEEHNDQPGRAGVLRMLGALEIVVGNLDAAEAHVRAALEIDQELGHKHETATGFGNLASIYDKRGQHDTARENAQQALSLFEELGSMRGIGNSLHAIGALDFEQGDLERAEENYLKALEALESAGVKSGIASITSSLGSMELARGNVDAAERWHKRSIQLEEELGNDKGVSIQLNMLGLIARQKGDLDVARTFHEQAMRIDERLGRTQGVAIQHANIGGIEHMRGNLPEARRRWATARDLFHQCGMHGRRDEMQGWLDRLSPTDPTAT